MFKVNLKEKLHQREATEEKMAERIISETRLLMEQCSRNDRMALSEAGLDFQLKEKEEEAGKRIDHIQKKGKWKGDVFTYSAIREIALDYDLRFLKTEHYKGSITPDLGSILVRFKEDNQLSEYSMKGRYFILAPASMFRITAHPKKDPMLFYKIDENNYKLVHKWGNDFTVLQRLKGIFYRNSDIAKLLLFLFYTLIGLPLYLYTRTIGEPESAGAHPALWVLFTIGAGISWVLFAFTLQSNKKLWDEPFTRHDWSVF